MRTAAEIRDRVKELIEGWIGLGGNVFEEQYKQDYFVLCRETQRAGYHEVSHSPRLSADALYEAISSQWSAHEDRSRLQALKQLTDMWREWLYALDRC